MSEEIAPSLAAIDAAWLTEALGAEVSAVEIEPVAFTGATTDMARIHVTYADGAEGPASVIAKITGPDELRAGMDAAMGLFAREGYFYENLADEVPVRSPRCYHVGDGTKTPLLLEDLASMRMGDQMEGLTVEDGERIIDAIAQLHAKYWGAENLETSWLSSPAQGTMAAMITQLVSSGAPALQEKFSDQAPEGVIDAVVERAPNWAEAVLVPGTEGPPTFVHMDVRLDNIFFADDGEPVLIDWQVSALTRGTQDVANLLAQSMDTDDLSANWEPLLRRYHGQLEENGVSGYSWDECLTHYRQNVPYALGAAMALIGAMDIGDGRGLGEAIAVRSLGHIAEVDSFGAL